MRKLNMEEDINQAQCECGLKKDDVYQSLDLINTWIANIDTKISFALALVGILIGMVFKENSPCIFQSIKEVLNMSPLDSSKILAAILVGLLYLTSFSSLICFIWAIIARVKNSNKVESIFFFASISKMELQNYKNKSSKITEKEIIEDLKEQVFINSKICVQKIKLYNVGMKFLIATVILWFLSIVFGFI